MQKANRTVGLVSLLQPRKCFIIANLNLSIGFDHKSPKMDFFMHFMRTQCQFLGPNAYKHKSVSVNSATTIGNLNYFMYELKLLSTF